jgi:hypothetical protein
LDRARSHTTITGQDRGRRIALTRSALPPASSNPVVVKKLEAENAELKRMDADNLNIRASAVSIKSGQG